jgi:diacylglycerol O-acyltransferase
VVEDAAGATWVEDRKFDIANARRAKNCPLKRQHGQSHQQALQTRVGELAMQPLDPAARCGTSTWWKTFVGEDGAAAR